jgi:hypothetical protein
VFAPPNGPAGGDIGPRAGVWSYPATVTTSPLVGRPLGLHSLSTASALLARQLGIPADQARWRLETVAESTGMSGTELAELILYRETVAH